METGKFFFIITFVCAVVGIFSGVNYFQGVDEANGQLIEAKSKLGQLKESWKVRQEEWAKIEVVATKAKEVADKEAPLMREMEELKAKYRRLEGEFKYLVSSTGTAVEKVRADAVGQELPEVKLINGKVLKAAKIRKIEPAQISFVHADGFMIVDQGLLPQELLERFDMGASTLVNEGEAAASAVFASPK